MRSRSPSRRPSTSWNWRSKRRNESFKIERIKNRFPDIFHPVRRGLLVPLWKKKKYGWDSFFFPIYFVTRVDFNTSYTGEMVIQFDGPALKQQQKNAAYVDTNTHTGTFLWTTLGGSHDTPCRAIHERSSGWTLETCLFLFIAFLRVLYFFSLIFYRGSFF